MISLIKIANPIYLLKVKTYCAFAIYFMMWLFKIKKLIKYLSSTNSIILTILEANPSYAMESLIFNIY